MTVSTGEEETINAQVLTDVDLVELAGYHAYRTVTESTVITVNGKELEVVSVVSDPESGLDAFTVQNTITVGNEVIKQYSLVYVGTNPKEPQDIITDANLLNDTPPLQLKAALDYFNTMEGEYGEISSISGNSLGGGTANYVAVNRPNVRAVTLNPALLPSGVIDRNQAYDNITNYISDYDILTLTLKGMGYGGRIPGNHYDIRNGIPDYAMLRTNHTGYISENGLDEQYYEIGAKGQPGYGKIYIDAGSHIMTSIWTGLPLYAGNSSKIEINSSNLKQLASGIETTIENRMELAREYLENSIAIVDHESSQYTKRVSKLQNIFQDMIEGEIGDTLFRGITTSSFLVKAEIDLMIERTYVAERNASSINLLLNSPPAQLLEFIAQKNVDVATIFESIRIQLRKFKETVDDVSAGLDQIMRKQLVVLFKGGSEMWLDAVVREMQAHFNIVDHNKTLMKNHIIQYRKQVYDTANSFEKKDSDLADAIQSKRDPNLSVEQGEESKSYKLQDSSYLVLALRMKEIQVNTGYAAFQIAVNQIVTPLLTILKGILSIIEQLLDTAISTIRGAMSFGLNWTLPGILLSAFTNFDDKVRAAVNNALSPIDDILELVGSLRIGVGRLITRLPVVIHNLKPYIDSAVFSNSGFYNVHLYNRAAVALFDDIDMLFEDIVNQLSDHKARSITSLQDLSQQVKYNIRLLREQTERGTLN